MKSSIPAPVRAAASNIPPASNNLQTIVPAPAMIPGINVNGVQIVAPSNLPKISKSIPVAIPAGTKNSNGQIVPAEIGLTYAGTRFYVRATSAPIGISTVRAGNIGAQNSFGVGQGQVVSDGFDTLRVFNYTLVPVVALIWVGFQDFINDQLVLDNVANPNVLFPTYSIAASATSVAINDLSGTTFVDINGKTWYALFRVAILVFNLDTAVTALLQAKGASTGTGNAGGVIPPAPLPIRFDVSGDFAINLGGSPINMIVSEIYSAFAAN